MFLTTNPRGSSKILVCIVTFYCAQNVIVNAFPSGCSKEKNDLFQSKLASKRDVFMSRGWGAGGMPYKVMYVNSKGTRTRKEELPKLDDDLIIKSQIVEDIEKPLQYFTSRSSGIIHGDMDPPRKQHSIIPQLFVSYGWGPLGK